MPRDIERTKRRIRDAALAEFAAHGQHGTTMERIAARSGVNKERIYSYFGDKAALFAAVVDAELDDVLTAVSMPIERLDDVGVFAGQSFDYQQTHPDLARLMLWQGLADTGGADDDSRVTAMYSQKLQPFIVAQHQGVIDDSIHPAYLVFLILGMVGWWSAAPQTARMFTGADPADLEERQRRRDAVVHAAVRLATPHVPEKARSSRARSVARG